MTNPPMTPSTPPQDAAPMPTPAERMMAEEHARQDALIAQAVACPLCGAGTFRLNETPLNRAPRMDGSRSPIISAYLDHWCSENPDDRFRTAYVRVRGRDAADAVASWNRRAPVMDARTCKPPLQVAGAMRLVPAEPTEEMRVAFARSDYDAEARAEAVGLQSRGVVATIDETWRAMLDAAPAAGYASREVVERVARGMCERAYRHRRRWDPQSPPAVEVEINVETEWRSRIPDAEAAIRDMGLDVAPAAASEEG